jgi:hypothetical protein
MKACHSEGIAMAAWPPEHDENVAQASCLPARSVQAGSLRYIFVVILFGAGINSVLKRIPTE